MPNHGWTATQLRTPLANRVKNAIRNKTDPSITNFAQFLDLAVREKLERLEATNA